MTAPVSPVVTFDKSVYNPGDTITASIAWQSGEQVESQGFTLTVTVQNQNSESVTATATFSVNTSAPGDTFSVQATDDGNRTWNVSMGADGVSATATTTA